MKFYRKIPGFRSGKRWKMVLAVLGYIFIMLIVLGVVMAESYHNDSPVTNTIKPAAEPSGKALIVYYSISSKKDVGYSNRNDGGYCEQTAYAIAQGLVSKNWEVTLLRVEPTPGNVLHVIHSVVGDTVEIKPIDLDVSNYDLVVIGSPTWNNGPVSAVISYIDQASHLEGKKVALFSTAGGYTSFKLTENKLKERGANVTDTLMLFSKHEAEAKRLAEEFGEKIGS